MRIERENDVWLVVSNHFPTAEKSAPTHFQLFHRTCLHVYSNFIWSVRGPRNQLAMKENFVPHSIYWYSDWMQSHMIGTLLDLENDLNVFEILMHVTGNRGDMAEMDSRIVRQISKATGASRGWSVWIRVKKTPLSKVGPPPSHPLRAAANTIKRI